VALDLIEIAPVPSAGRKLTRGRIERLLKQHRIVGLLPMRS